MNRFLYRMKTLVRSFLTQSWFPDDGSPSEETIADLQKTVQELRGLLADSQRIANEEKSRFSETIESLGEKEKGLSASKSMSALAYSALTLTYIDSKIANLEKTVQKLHVQFAESQRKADGLTQILHAHEQKHHCESLYAEDRIIDAAESVLDILTTMSEEVRANKLLMDWLVGESQCRIVYDEGVLFVSTEFTNRCTSKLELIGDETSNVDEALTAYATALSLGPSAPNALLVKWAKLIIIHDTVDKALGTPHKVCFTCRIIF